VPRDFEGETSEALAALRILLPTDLAAGISSAVPNGSHTDLLSRSLEFQAALVADLVHARKFDDKATWSRCIGVYLAIWTDANTSTTFAETVRSHYHALDQVG
jgi:elongation factor 3